MIKFKICGDTKDFIKHKSVMVLCDGGLVKVGYVDYNYFGNGYGEYVVKFSDGSSIPILGMPYCEIEVENY